MSLPTEKEQIIARIQELHRLGEPLNITAVKRRHPDLVKAVYDMKPFWGWRGALESAGLSYRDIRVELIPTVRCEICGQAFRTLGSHLFFMHHMRPREYVKAHPGCPLMSELHRSALTKALVCLIPHWEPIWSREYILDRLVEYHRLGIPISANDLHKKDAAFVKATYIFWGSMRKAMMAAGLDPMAITAEAYRRHRRYPTSAAVIAEIQRRHRAGLRLTISAVRKPRNGKCDEGLISSGIKDFGSWAKALEAAGFDSKKIQSHPGTRTPTYKNSEDVIRALQKRVEEGKPVTHAAIYHGAARDVALTRAGKAYFGSWDDTLRAAGFNPTVIKKAERKGPRYPNADAVLAAIRERAEKGLSLKRKDVVFGDMRNTNLVVQAIRHIGSWYLAVEKAGFDPVKAKKNLFPESKGVP